MQLRNISTTKKEIEELQSEDNVHIDTDIVGHPPPSLRGASTSSNPPQSRMSHLEMENKITLLSSEVDGLKKTILEIWSHFDLEFSKLRAIVDKQVRILEEFHILFTHVLLISRHSLFM